MRLRVLFPILLVLSACSGEPAGDALVDAGEQMYREGILPSGEPMRAIVAGDVPIVGTQFSCESCHGRSGTGASEGAYVVPAIGAQFPFSPSPQPARPAYDKESLARVLREGITPSGRELMAELMPRYELSDDDFHTVYYSRGLMLEADLIAAHLKEQPAELVLQVWCDANLAPAVAALRESVEAPATAVRDVTFDCDDPAPFAELAPQLADGAAAVLWLRPEQFSKVNLPEGRIYASSALLDAAPETGLATTTGSLLVAHPFRLPNSVDPAMRRFQAWAKSRQVDVSYRRAQAEAFYASLVFKNVVKRMRRYYVREYALDVVDHAEGMAAYLPLYPRPSFGPGQRYINKGGYVLPIVDGKADTTDAAWILP